jgi:hypothetical protein
MKGPQYWWQLLKPLSYIRLWPIKDYRLYALKDHAIRAFHLTVTPRVWYRGIVDLDARVSTKVFELPRNELSPIIGDNVFTYAKPVYDLIDEFHCLGSYNGGSRLYFDPLCEFVHCNEDVCEFNFSFQTDLIDPAPMLRKAKWSVWFAIDEMAHVSGEWKTNNLRNDELGSRHQIPWCVKRTPAYMSSPRAILHLCDCHRSLHGCPTMWYTHHLEWCISLECH